MRTTSMRGRIAVLVSVGGLLLTPATSAQPQGPDRPPAIPTYTGLERLDFDRPESWAMKYFDAVTLPTGTNIPRPIEAGSIRIALEGGWVPSLSAEQRTVGFNGTKEEDLNQTPVMGRPHLIIGLPADITLTLGYVPPLPIRTLRPSLFMASIGLPVATPGHLVVATRAFGQVGHVRGAFTCSAEEADAGDDLVANPLGCKEASEDVVLLRHVGLELGLAYEIAELGGLEPFVAVAGTYVAPLFEVNALDAAGRDRTRLLTTGFTFSSAAGLRMPIGSRVAFEAEAFYSPLWIERAGEPREQDGLFNVRGQLVVRLN